MSKVERLAQYQKFKEAARKLETDDSEEAFDRVLKKVVKAPPRKDEPKAAAKK
ncbi:MAG: DNA-binding protein [Mesorhizobium sp.]|nr:MAG: DNA-binding protein [Mesorhizobium sp.]